MPRSTTLHHDTNEPRPAAAAPYAMADSAASSSSRSPSTSSAKGRSRAASAGDERGPARTAVEPALQTTGAEGPDADGLAAQPPHFDPRQGTLLGFELPESWLLSMTATGSRDEAPLAQTAEIERAVPAEVAGVEKAAGIAVDDAAVDAVVDERPATNRLPAAAEKTIVTDKTVAADTRVTAEKPVSGRKAARAEKAITPATAGISEAVAIGPAPAAAPEPATSPAPATAPASATAPAPTQPGSAASSKARRPEASTPSAAVFLDMESAPPASPELTALIRTVASLEAAFVQERRAAEARWRRTRHWPSLSLAGLALLLAVCVGQTVAFIGFAHRSEAAQQQMQSALTEQQAALAGLSSATAALSAAPQTPEAPDAASAVSATTQPAKHTKPAHLRHPKEKAKAAAH